MNALTLRSIIRSFLPSAQLLKSSFLRSIIRIFLPFARSFESPTRHSIIQIFQSIFNLSNSNSFPFAAISTNSIKSEILMEL